MSLCIAKWKVKTHMYFEGDPISIEKHFECLRVFDVE